LRLDKKGQASAELIIVTVVFLVIAGSLINLASSEMDKSDAGNLGEARMMGEALTETINTVYTNGPGYSANLTLQNLSNSASYTVLVYTVSNTGYLNVSYHSSKINIKLIPNKITTSGAMSSGTIHQVTNNNGTIVIN
jgi:hypothetical protein